MTSPWIFKELKDIQNYPPISCSAEICGYHIVRHPSCQPHIAGCPQGNQKIKSIQEGKDRTSQTEISLHLLAAFPRRHRSKRIVDHGHIITPEDADFHEGEMAQSSASQARFPGRRRGHYKKNRRRKDEDTSDPEVVNPSLGRERSNKRRLGCDSGIVSQPRKLDSSIFERHMENLWTSFSEEKRSSFAYLDSLWFSSYTKKSYKAKVLAWIKKKQIFSKKYVFVPIIRWSHWSLLILCHFGESPETKSRTPCMLLLDSLQMANSQRLVPEIRKFVLGIYKAEGRPEIQKQISRIPLRIPKVPQQRNADECGKFVLYYINLFIENAPENFSISQGYPYFMKKNWFTAEGLESFCKRFDSVFCRESDE